MKYSVLSFVLVSLVSLVHADTFNNSNSHSIINTKEAWNQNITGKGVVIGIVDTPINDNHNYLKDKILDSDIYKPDQITNYIRLISRTVIEKYVICTEVMLLG